jgi:hypothetical protein
MRSVSFERGNLLITIERFNKCIIADALIGANYSPKSLSAVSGAPRDATVRSCMLLAGRFGYSDLKEAAHMGVYVLWIGRSGCRWFGNMPSWVGSVCLVAE